MDEEGSQPMKSITILKKGATILHDGIVAQSPEGKPVFIVPANLPAPQLDVHPQGMIVYSLPEQQFPPFVVQLLASKERLRFAVRSAPEDDRGAHAPYEQADNPRSQLRTHQLDLSAEDADDEKTG
jgi:hypothetical protein